MSRSERPAVDMMTLARLHAALDSVLETEQLIAAIREASAISSHAVVRVAELVSEAREVLRGMLARPDPRHRVGMAVIPRGD